MLVTERQSRTIDKIENFSPLDPIHTVLYGTPGMEAAMALALPSVISLFQARAPEAASVLGARRDLERMSREMEARSITTFNMRHVLAEALADKAHHRYTTKTAFLNEAVKRTEYIYQKYSPPPSFESIIAELEELLDDDIQTLGLEQAIAINGVLTNIIGGDGREKPFHPIMSPPIGNFLYWRDPSHITGSTIATHRMFWPIRQQEVALAELGLRTLGLPHHRMSLATDETIEGGDIMPIELNGQLYALIGQAERTTWAGVKKWYELHESLFSQSGAGIIPAMVEGPTHDTQDQMHLDTYFAQVAANAIIHCGEITKARQFSILTRRGGEIVKLDPQQFSDWIEKSVTDHYDMTKAEQDGFAPNVLVDGSESKATTVYITCDGTPGVTEFIQRHAAETVLTHMNDLVMFYGGIRCASSEMRRHE